MKDLNKNYFKLKKDIQISLGCLSDTMAIDILLLLSKLTLATTTQQLPNSYQQATSQANNKREATSGRRGSCLPARSRLLLGVLLLPDLNEDSTTCRNGQVTGSDGIS
jgi:hypothetical protein